MTAAGVAAEMVDFCHGCGSSDGSPFMGSSRRSPPMNVIAVNLAKYP